MTTEELNRVLDDEFERCTPELSIVPSAVVSRGRRRVRARRAGLAGGGAAVIAAVALLVPTVFAGGTTVDGGHPDYSGPRQQDPGDYPVALDPDVEYIWSADEARFDEEEEVNAYKATPETEELTAAWFAALANLGVQPQGHWNEEVLRHNEVLTPDGDQTGAYGGWGGDESVVLAERPVYSAQVGITDGLLSMEVFPAGSFLRGARTQSKNPNHLLPDPRYLVPGCDSYTETLDVPLPTVVETTFECVDFAGPDGEQILSVRPSIDRGDGPAGFITYLALYREDGSAVLITERNMAETGPPVYTDEQLTDLALALPAVPVV